ncbi:PSD1 and planctomycete cytochrome C domain-containing protein [Lentisphaera profundi]|uniref:PSD1 and planctomycete cytochrome C domain-containing protein n=1 Tax=Lentisphaera profundi TaxID=1658616 RepID=A0ABY7W283_9BACT|nr:PSD1 and planctomycete cytochrome C domain-containing protein [Lentisphaera profundi]WDE99222.1 PSD1 and planctomycete cytochrome C domain-containing protein [Lentisphaera profundi]
MKQLYLLSTLLFFTLTTSANEGMAFFEKKIRPALEKYCYRCHSDKENKVKGGLVLDSKHGLLTGGDTGPAIVPNNLGDSILWESIKYLDYEMPPKEPMPDAVIEDFKKWILMGAPDPRVQEKITVKSTVSEKDIREGRNFWSMQKPTYQAAQKNGSPEWSQNEIDRYIYADLSEHKLTPNPIAKSNELVRRLYFDLIGLPPSPGEIERFNSHYKHNPKSAMTHTANELIMSSHFGEKWGRHWLDVARYAETTGQGRNMSYPHAWRYRDYVIDSFNQDKPYNIFLQEQIAGDLLKTKTDEEWVNNLVATSFLALGSKALPEDDKRKFNADLVDEQIDLVTRGVMGLSVSCARCHDHKFDPIPQKDYYALAGIFQSSKTYYGTTSNAQNRHPSSLIKLPTKNVPNITKPISPSELAQLKDKLKDAESKMRQARMSRRNAMENNTGKDAQSLQRDIGKTQNQFYAVQEQINSVDANGQPISFCMGMQPSTLTNAKILERGEVNRPGQEIPRGFVQIINPKNIEIGDKTNGRKELAYWISSKDNPLTARVMANRIWMKLMGQALVRSPDNFGKTGSLPSNQKLLDYLALDFMKEDWSVKNLVRSIVLSRAYQSSSTYKATNFKTDPDNKYFWRVEPKKLEAEAIRDSILQIAGKIDITPPIASDLAKLGQVTLGRAKRLEIDIAAPYRSVYIPIVRDQLPDILQAFDFPASMTSSSVREANNTAAQALYMLNSDFVLDMSSSLAKRLIHNEKSLDKQISLAFELCLGRSPKSHELSNAKKLYQMFYNSSELKKNEKSTRMNLALSSVCQSLFASAEFRYLN